jgi:hypothetical protein
MLLISVLAATVVAIVGVAAMTKHPGIVYPFAPAKRTVADTLTSDAETVFADDGWSVATLTRLSEVEDLLDCLEAHSVSEREVRVVGNSNFRVRWK